MQFPEIYLRFRLPVLSYVKARVRDPETAAELTQEIFLKAYRLRDHYRPDQGGHSTWLRMIARSSVTDHLRRARAVTVDSAEEIPTLEPSAEALLLSRELGRDARGALRVLTRPQRRVFILRAIRQLSCREIAAKLGLSLAAVKNLSHRARVSLAGHRER